MVCMWVSLSLISGPMAGSPLRGRDGGGRWRGRSPVGKAWGDLAFMESFFFLRNRLWSWEKNGKNRISFKIFGRNPQVQTMKTEKGNSDYNNI